MSTLHSFSGSTGRRPRGASVLVEGDLLGAAAEGGAHDLGVLFALRESGEFDVLHSFARSDGA